MPPLHPHMKMTRYGCRIPVSGERRSTPMPAMTYDDSAHLLRRMAFGGTPEEIRALPAKSRERAVDALLNFDTIDNSALESRLQKSFNPKKFTPNDDLQ